MCGIVGTARFDGAPLDMQLLGAMRDTLVHRGPDDSGSWVDDRVGLGHRRLSIIDVGGSAQPMASNDDRWHLCFNGEIFNYRQQRMRLDYEFRTGGDTEVLLATMAHHGLTGLADLNGQFAFACYDSVSGDLWLVRDRLGVLPLYYHLDSHRIVFASEVKAVLLALDAQEVDEASIDDYLSSRSVSSPFTMFAGVRKVPPGHGLRIDRAGQVALERYWAPPPPDQQLEVSPGEAVDLVADALERAVEAAMVADVPVGAYLSGGVDSSLIVALMSRVKGARVQTFSAGFGEHSADELPYARAVSEHLGTRHHEVPVLPEDFADSWRRLTWHRDAPISEPADIAVNRLAELARTTVKVVLSGEGSDELFAGYPKYRYAGRISRVDIIPARARAAGAGLMDRAIPPAASRLRVALRAAGAADPEERMRAWFAPFTASERARLLGDTPTRRLANIGEGQGDLVRRMLYTDCHSWLSDNLLERGDRMSMAASLELRPPFLDRDVVDLAFRLPTDVKIRDGRGKWVVKEVARRHLPREIVDRRKVGFRVPLETWFRGGLRSMAWDLLDGPDSFVGSVLDRPTVRALLTRHDKGRHNEEMRIWTLLCLEVWHQVFFVESTAGAATPTH